MTLALWLLASGALPTVETPLGPRPASAAWCAECHWTEEGQWSHSRHAVSATNVLYRANHAQEPMRWCDGCHAPLGDETEGVGCASCHVKDGAIRAGKPGTPEALEAHAIAVDPGLRTVDACATCHTVMFPVGHDEPVTLSQFPMQDTVREWRSTGTAEPCQKCHVAAGDHSMSGGHDVGKLRETVSVSVERLDGDEVRVRLGARGAAHAVPTGDPFRAFRVELCADAECERVVVTRTAGRTIRRVGDTWRITSDWTIPPPVDGGVSERALEFAAPTEAAYFRVVMVWIGESTARLLPRDETEVELFRGAVQQSAR